MALSTPLLEELADFAKEAAQVPLSPPETAKERWLLAVEDIAAAGRRLRGSTDRLRDQLMQFVAVLSGEPHGVDLDEVIEALGSTEHQTKTTLTPVINRAKAVRNGTFSLPGTTPGERARAIAAVDHYIAALNESLEMLRDFRWTIMTIRADKEDPGDAPVFDDPEKLMKYLHSRSE